MKVVVSILIIFFIAGVIFSACTWTTGGPGELIFPEKDVTYLHHVRPFLELNCSYSICHSEYNFAGGIALVEHHQVMWVPNFVISGNPDASKFVQILENRVTHFTRFYRGNITENHIQGIRQWITEGAINK